VTRKTSCQCIKRENDAAAHKILEEFKLSMVQTGKFVMKYTKAYYRRDLQIK